MVKYKKHLLIADGFYALADARASIATNELLNCLIIYIDIIRRKI